jgi:hypothetical protein
MMDRFYPPNVLGCDYRFPAEREALLKANPWLVPWQENWVRETGFQGPGAKGWARRGRLYVAPAACTLPGRGYSWPGSVSDCTVRGVYLHEVGHIVHAALGDREAEALAGLRTLPGPPVTGYEPNAMETFAETFRIFAGNPALLEIGRPWRFEYLLSLGVQPPAGKPTRWQTGMIFEGNSPPPRFIDQCERWIDRGRDWLKMQANKGRLF